MDVNKWQRQLKQIQRYIFDLLENYLNTDHLAAPQKEMSPLYEQYFDWAD